MMKTAISFLAFLGFYALLMFCVGYLYASIPLIKEHTCRPDLVDRVLK
jgi:hypothetical protein